MRYFLIKFNHGVEIGAYLAYKGHCSVTHDPLVWEIAKEEIEHRKTLAAILREKGTKPSWIIDNVFYAIGRTIQALCHVSPIWMLDFVARSMEVFAIFNYRYLAKLYPEYELVFLEMAATEGSHEMYFGY